MDLETFLYNLHFDTDKARPPDLEVAWDDAPLAYKLYRGLPTFPLSLDVPLTLEGQRSASLPDLRDIGHFLWYAYGLTALSQSGFAEVGEPSSGIMHMYRRFAPSGGALYPSELYVYLNIKDIPVGVYHYDVAHHRLILLREGQFHPYLIQALANRCNLSHCFGAIFVSTMFWKNFYKYNNFAYRLQGLDAGVLMGQVLEVAKRFGFESAVCFQFLDSAVNHLLGLSEWEESVYAVIPLSVESAANWFITPTGGRTICATELCRALPSVEHNHYVRSRRVQDYPLLIQMNEASKLETLPLRVGQPGKQNCGGDCMVPLPCVTPSPYDLATVCRSRYSPGTDFVLGKVSQEQLATLLKETALAFSYRNDLDLDGGLDGPGHRVSLYGCLYGVEGVEDGAYYYDSAAHALRQIDLGDHRYRLQEGMSMHNVNLSQVPLCFHVGGDRDHLKQWLGYRGYRIQQMEAGMLVQHLLLTASATGMNGHPLLGFDAGICDEIYKMVPLGMTSLIQIPVGPHRLGSKLEGSFHG